MNPQKTKSKWLFPLILVLAAAVVIAAILLFVKKPQTDMPIAPATEAIQTDAVTQAASETEPVTESPTETEAPTEAIAYASHAPYMSGANAFFSPDKLLTRAEAARLIFRLFGGTEEGDAVFYDVTEDPEILRAGVYFPTVQYGYFLPDEPILREDLFAAICSAAGFELPEALAYADAPYTAFALQNDWFYADEISDFITRGETAHVFNRVLERAADRSLLLQQAPIVFLDVPPRHPYYCDVMEAAVAHTCLEDKRPEQWNEPEFETPDSGLYLNDGFARYLQEDGTLLTTPGLNDIPSGTVLVADETGRIYADNRPHLTPDGVVFCRWSGTILKNGSWNGYVLDENGFYSSGDAALDGYVNAVYDECTTDEMSQEEKLRACFDYVADFSYLGRNRALDDSVKTMPYDLAQGYALKIFETGKGDCYNFAAAFLFLARGLGYDAEAIIGYCGYTWSRNAIAHSWITLTTDDGTQYLFDPQIENYNRRRGISNELYGAFMMTYDNSHANYYPN